MQLIGINTTIIYYLFFLIICAVYAVKPNKISTNLLRDLVHILILLYFVSVSSSLSPHNETFYKYSILVSRTLIPIVVFLIYQHSNYKISQKYIYIIAIIYTGVLLFNGSQVGYLLRTGLLIENTENSRILSGVIEDSRSLSITILIILLYFRKSIINIPFISFLFIGILITQTRQTLLGFLLIIIPYFGILSINNSSYRKLFMKSLFFIIVTGIILYNIEFTNAIIYQIDRYDIVNISGSDFNRYRTIEHSISSFMEKPIFGHGFAYTDSHPTHSYPHNIILEILSEFGLLGFSIFALIFTYRWKLMKKTESRILIVYTLFLSMISGNIATNFFLFLFLFVDISLIIPTTYTGVYYAKN